MCVNILCDLELAPYSFTLNILIIFITIESLNLSKVHFTHDLNYS